MALFMQDERPPEDLGPPAEGKKWVKVVEVVDGHDVEKWVQVDDVQGPAWGRREDLQVLNQDIRRNDVEDKVTGRAKYAHDQRPEGMLYGRMLLCRVPKASVKLDLEPARALAGVHAVIQLLDGDTTTFLGQPLAAVAAETPELCEDAIRAIRADLEELPWTTSYETAIAPNAPLVSTGRDRSSNVREDRRTRGNREDAEAALEGCDAVIEQTYVCPVQHHVCLETHGLVVDYRGGDEATIYASTQVASGYVGRRSPLPEELGLDAGKIQVKVEFMGGGFGSKFGPGTEGYVACMLSGRTKRPIHMLLNRADEFLFGGNRSGGVQTLKGGATRDGKLKALVADVVKLGGVGGGSNPGHPYIYSVEEAYSGGVSVHTNTDSSRAMRAPGHPQASFAMESMVDELAYAVGHDPLDFRIQNLEDEVYHRQLNRAAREIGWFDHENRTAPGDPSAGEPLVGIGFGIATWGGGGRGGNVVEVKITSDGAITSSVGSQDLGTGTKTYVAAIVAEELGLPADAVTPRVGDSFLGSGTGSGGSTTTASLAPSVKNAAFNAAAKLREHLAGVLGKRAEDLSFAGGKVLAAGEEVMDFRQACATLPASGLTAVGEWSADLQASGIHGAQAAKVEVDPLTGRVKILKMVAVQDCGLPLNRLAVVSQLNGGVIQALSYGLLEERVIDEDLGVMLNANLEDYKIAGVHEIPELVSLIDDEDTRQKVIGMAEPAIVPGHSALANAIYNACGARLRTMPFTPDKVLMALQERG